MEMTYANMMRSLLKVKRSQGSFEYIMMLSAVSIIVVLALAMMTQLKGTAIHSFFNSSSGSVPNQLSNELGNLTGSR